MNEQTDERQASAGQVERPVRPLLERLRAGHTDWDGSQMADETQPMDCLTAGDVREAADEIERLRDALKTAQYRGMVDERISYKGYSYGMRSMSGIADLRRAIERDKNY